MSHAFAAACSCQQELFDPAPPAPALVAGWRYQADFLGVVEEAALLDVIARLPLEHARYKAYSARRRIASYGTRYDFSVNRLEPGPPVPPALWPLRDRVGAWLGIEPENFVNVLVADYPGGTPLGWHRDVPDFDTVVGISLLGTARLRFRPYPPLRPSRRELLSVELPRRSAYVLSGPARWAWQHSVAPTREARQSITLRTAARRPVRR